MIASGKSLGQRLLLAAAAFIAVALVVAAVAIGFALHRFVQGQIDQRLDTQIRFLASMVRVAPDGNLALAGSADGPPFERMRHGWYWQINGARNVLRSASLEGETLDLPDAPAPRPPKDKDRKKDGKARPADGVGPDDERLHFRFLRTTLPDASAATIIATAPRGAVWGPLREAMTTLALSLIALGVALMLAMVAQVRLGLRPLDRLRLSIADIRAGASERLSPEQPREIAPLAAEVNALLDQNAANLDRARKHVANLAHGLKTPLSTLSLALASRDGAADLVPLVGQMERRIRHHLGRARMAALSGPARARTPLAERLSDIAAALGKINAGKAVTCVVEMPAALAVACEPQDVDEMAGNLLENAFAWSVSRVSVTALSARDGQVAILVDDDGPGVSEADAARVLHPGARLDESVEGFGFGLSITRELAELYGGALTLSRATLGGLRAELRLPVS